MKAQAILLSAGLCNLAAGLLLLCLVVSLAEPAARSILRDIAPPPPARCALAASHDYRPACMVGLRATALNGRRLSGVVCHGDLGLPTVRMLG